MCCCDVDGADDGGGCFKIPGCGGGWYLGGTEPTSIAVVDGGGCFAMYGG